MLPPIATSLTHILIFSFLLQIYPSGEGVVIGMSTVIAPTRKVGAWSTVVVNSAVISDIPEGVACGGVPAIVFGPSGSTKVA